MKKIIVAALIAIGLSASAQASIFVAWQDNSGFVMPDLVTPILDPSVGGSALVQLIWTGNGVVDDATIGGGVAGANEVLAQMIIDEVGTGNPYGATFSAIYGPVADRAGFLYVRVFQGGTGIGSVAAGSWYFSGALHATVNNSGGAQPPDFVDAGVPPNSGSGPFGTFALNQQVVPEPTTLALAALGVLGVVARRFRRS